MWCGLRELCAQPLSLAGDWSSGGVRLTCLDQVGAILEAQEDIEHEWGHE
jgi:hypothetical protein